MTSVSISAESIEHSLTSRGEPPKPSFLERQASVAILLRFEGDEPEVLLMRRIVRSDDPWSGQVSLPGGSAKDIDRDLVATAVRETQEEVEVDLESCARLVGHLDPIRPVPRGLKLPLFITPLVFFQTSTASPAPGDEAQRVFWFPLGRAAAGELDSSYTWKIGPTSRDFPCWRFDGEVVWGLTHRILVELLGLVRGTTTDP